MNLVRWGGLALVVVLVLPALLASPSPAADVDSAQPLGLAEVTERIDEEEREVQTLFASPSALRTEPDAAVVLVPGVPRSLSPGEIRALEHQMAPEGEIWLLDETGAAGEITEPQGVRVVPDPLLDPTSPYGDARFVEAEARLGNTTYDLLLSSPTLLEVDENRSTVLARAQDAVRDVDGSGEIEPTDPSGDLPVMATLQLDGRQVLAASDTGWLTNTVLRDANYDNAAFLDALLARAPHGDLVVDASRHEPARWLTPVKTAMQSLLWLATNWLALGMTATGVVGATVLAVRRGPEDGPVTEHEHEIGRYQALDPATREQRLRWMLVRVLSEQGDRDPSEMLGLDDEQLAQEGQRVLGTKEYLTTEGDMEPRFRELRRFLREGGANT